MPTSSVRERLIEGSLRGDPRREHQPAPWVESTWHLAADAVGVGGAVVGIGLAQGHRLTVWHAVFAIIAVATMASRGGYARRLEDSLVVVVVRHVLVSAAIATMATVTLRVLFGAEESAAAGLILVFAGATFAMASTRVISTTVARRRRRAGRGVVRALVVGVDESANRIVRRLRHSAKIGLQPIGFLDDHGTGQGGLVAAGRDLVLPTLGRVEDLDAVVDRHRIDAIIVSPTVGADSTLWMSELVTRAHERRMTVFVVPRLHDVVNTRTRRHRVSTLPVDELRPVDPRSRAFRAKYAIDRVIGSLALLAMAPVMIVIALVVKATSPGPVFFSQRRVGLDGREFEILKFRSMREPARPEGLASVTVWVPEAGTAPGGVEGEDRRTWIGRFLRTSNLDELPQLINIAKGEMCLVGPRPERPEFVEQFSREFHTYDDRHRVKAGLTGWAQVHGLRGQTSIAERAAWDNYYIENWSFALDIAIIVRTVKTFFEPNQ